MGHRAFFVDTVEDESPTAKRHRIREVEYKTLAQYRTALQEGQYPDLGSARAAVKTRLNQRIEWLQHQLQQARHNLDRLDFFYRKADVLSEELQELYSTLVAGFDRCRLAPQGFQAGMLTVHARAEGAETVFAMLLQQNPVCLTEFDDLSCSILSHAMQEVGWRIVAHREGPGHPRWQVRARLMLRN